MKIVLVDDFGMVVELLRTICVDHLGYEVVGVASDGARAVQVILASRPDIAVLDLRLPRLSGHQVIEMIRELCPETRIVVCSAYCDDYTVSRLARVQISGFISKASLSLAAFEEAMSAVNSNGAYFSQDFLKRRAALRSDPAGFDKLLSKREQEVLLALGDLATNDEIATQLRISPCTITKHIFNATRKLGLASRLELVRYARDHGFVPAVTEKSDPF